jgi:hypothetical protein
VLGHILLDDSHIAIATKGDSVEAQTGLGDLYRTCKLNECSQ